MEKFLLLAVFLTAFFMPVSSYAFEPQHCQIGTAAITDSLAKFCEIPRAAKEITIQNNMDKEIRICDSDSPASGTFSSECWPILATNQLAAETLSSKNPTSLFIEYTDTAPSAGKKVIVTWKKR